MPPAPRLDEAMGVGSRGPRSRAQGAPPNSRPEELLLLPGEAGALTLRSGGAVSSAGPRPPADKPQHRGEVLRVYRWSQFLGKEEVTEFDEAHFAAEGIFSQNSSQGHQEYQDRLRAIHFRKEGKQKAEIAKLIGRSEKFVAKWWQKEGKEVPRPWGVHEYMAADMGSNENGVGSTSGAVMVDKSAKDAATRWRDVEVRRNFAADPAIYEEILQNTEWKPTNARTRDFATGAYHVKYDQRGNIKWEGHQAGTYKPGISPAMDKMMQKLFVEYGIADRTSGVITNWYPDGTGYLGSHRHDCWTALFSFGYERILTIDNTPLLMQDGDLCIFGTQRHGVPTMPEISEGRITVVVFFYPDQMQKQGMWQTISDPETMAPSRPLVAMLRDRHLGAAAELRALSGAAEAASQEAPIVGAAPVDEDRKIVALQQLGFSRADAWVALRACGGDADMAAEVLLLAPSGEPGGLEEEVEGLDEVHALIVCEDKAAPPLGASGGRFRKQRAAPEAATPREPADTCSVASTSAPSSGPRLGPDSCGTGSAGCRTTGCSSAEEDLAVSDEALARRLQLEDAGHFSLPGPHSTMQGCMTDEEVAALAIQLEELDAFQSVGSADVSLMAAQFQEYEAALVREDAEEWNGHGDLMHSPFTREHLTLETMDKATLYSVGHGDMLEKDFWEMLQCNSIRVLYDIRPTDYRGELHSRHQRFSVPALRAQCRTRGIFYKSVPLGRESAYGTLAHIKTDEGRHTLVELAWQAKRKRTAFLGSEESWHDDARQVAADELAKAGHTVEHIRSDGGTEQHVLVTEYPDWLLREEDRLRTLEKKRQAGELARPQKSRVDRSSESVAAKLARPAEEVDAMEALRGAANQKELIVAQRKLARYQRVAEEKGALATKVVTNVPEWVVEEARRQAEWVATKKKEKEGKAGGLAAVSSSKAMSAEYEAASESTPALASATAASSSSSSHLACAYPPEANGEEPSASGTPPRPQSTWRSRRRVDLAASEPTGKPDTEA